MQTIIAFVLSLFIIAGHAERGHAQESSSASDACQLRVATGKKGKGFSRLLRDIRSVCGTQVRLCEVETEGGLRNSTALSANEADIGFVQVDTLQDMKQSDDNIAALQAIMAVNANLLHILVRRDGFTIVGERSLSTLFRRDDRTLVITRASELKGLPVAVVGSAQHLGRMLERSFGLGLRFVDFDSDEQAIASLKAGDVAAVLCMNGWPSASVEALSRDDGITLASYDLPVQAPYLLVHKNYSKLGRFGLAFLAAPNLLVTRPFKPDGVRGGYIARLQRCMVEQLDALREGVFEPAWKEIKNPDEAFGWPRFTQSAAR